MLKIFVILNLLLVFSSASDTQGIKVLCIEEKSVGFSWEHSKWEKANFTPQKYLIKKVDNLKCSYDPINTKKIHRYENSYLTDGCYQFGVFGKKPSANFNCAEILTKKGNTFNIDYVSCSFIDFKLNGDFVKSRHTIIFSDKSSSSPHVSYGTCAEL